MRRASWYIAAIVGACGAFLGGCGAERDPVPAKRQQQTGDVKLPRGVWPRSLTFDDKGGMWISESSANAVAQRLPSGRIVHHRLGEATETSVDDLAQSDDGAIWFQGFQIIGRVDPTSGLVTGRQTSSDGLDAVGAPAALTAGPDGAVYFVDTSFNEAYGLSPNLRRIDSLDSFATLAIPWDEEFAPDIDSITAGPDDALWFPVTYQETTEIGRMSTAGEYTSFPLPREYTPPGAITAGSDGALWFTEQSRYRINRMTTEGKASSFKLRPGQTPFDIVSGPDGALWFTLKRAIGRITTTGETRTWPMPRAKSLYSLEFSPDGTLWITDPEADMVRRFRP